VLFLPTIWLTGPIGDLLHNAKHYYVVFWMTVGEELFLGALYGTILYLLLRQRLGATLRALASRWHLVALFFAVTIAVSVGARVLLARADAGEPIRHAKADRPRREASPCRAPVTLTKESLVKVPGDSNIIARSGFDLLVLPPGEMNRTTFEEHGPLAVIRAGRLEPLSGEWSISLSGTEPRCTSGGDDPIVVINGAASGGAGSNRVSAMTMRDLLAGHPQSAAIGLPTGFQSPLVVRSGQKLLVTGFTYESTGAGVAKMPEGSGGSGGRQAPNLAIYDVSGGRPVMVGAIDSFSDHDSNNLASATTSDGIVHLIATEVLVGHGNSARVHYLRFDPRALKWLGDEVLAVRTDFTSTITPNLAASGSTLDAFWLPEGGSNTLPGDGLYAYRIGEKTVWRLTEARGEYAILPNADGHGAVLVGVAIHPSEDGKIQWFLRRGEGWFSAGQADLGTKLYTLTIDGTEPFALWRDPSSGTTHAAFSSPDGLQVAEVKLGE
jgi:hypothetical protein